MTNRESKPAGGDDSTTRVRRPRGMGGIILILALLMALFLVVSKAGIEGSSSIDAFYSHLLNGQVEDLTLSDGLATAQIRVGDRGKTMEVVVRDLLREDTELYRTLPKLKLDPDLYGHGGGLAQFLQDVG